MAGKKDQPIIIKKVKKVSGHGGHHGGAWKIAYADFVTAMMAFFLLMWLLATADKQTLRGLSDYFNNPPVRLSLMGGENVGEQTRPLPGGGKDMQSSDGAVAPPIKKSQQQIKEEMQRQEREKLKELQKQIEAAIDSIPSLQPFKGQLLLDLTSEGLRIQILDQESRPMFDQGRAQLKPYASEILSEITKLINTTENRISISGHTDATSYIGGEAGYSNWELSNDRANAARRQLVGAGLDPTRVMRVVGLADTVLLDGENPQNPQNRRISIVLMNKDTEASISEGEGESPPPAEGEPGAEAEAGAEVAEPGAAAAGEAPAAEAPPSAPAAPPAGRS